MMFEAHKFEDDEVRKIVKYFKNSLFSAIDIDMKKEEYSRIIEFNILEYIVNKLSVYRLADVSLRFDFMSVVCKNAARLLQMTEEGF